MRGVGVIGWLETECELIVVGLGLGNELGKRCNLHGCASLMLDQKFDKWNPASQVCDDS